MTRIKFRQLGGEALRSVESIPSDEAMALAGTAGGCMASRFPLFVEFDADQLANPGLGLGDFAAIEFILPGKPGRWRAAGEVVMAVSEPRPDAPLGVGLELLGLVLCGETQAPPGSESNSADEVEAPAEPAPFDASALTIDHTEVAGMLGDLLGRDVTGEAGSSFSESIGDQAVFAVYRDDDEKAQFLVAFDKGGAARVGGALTLMPAENLQAAIDAPEPLEGEPLTNAGEVLNIMAALFQGANAPQVALAETLLGADLAAEAGGELAILIAEASWRLELRIDIEDYGVGEVLLLAR